PELIMSLFAVKLKDTDEARLLRPATPQAGWIEVIVAPPRLKILAATMDAFVTLLLDDTMSKVPELIKFPTTSNAAPECDAALKIPVTPDGICRALIWFLLLKKK